MPCARGGLDQRARGFERVRDGFFDQDIQAELHQPAADFGMRDGGRRDDGGVGVLRPARSRLAKTGQPCGAGDLGGPRRVQVQNAGQLGMLRLMNHAQMIPAEAPAPDDCDTRFHACCPDMPIQHTG